MDNGIMRSLTESIIESFENDFVVIAEQDDDLGEARQLAQDIKTEFEKYFPKSYINSEVTTNIKSGIFVRWTLGNGKSEYANGIRENDPLHHLFNIRVQPSSDGYKYQTELLVGGELWTINGKVKIGFRKTTGDAKKVLDAMKRYIKKMYKVVEEHADEIKAPFGVREKI